MKKTPIQKAVDVFGSQAALAKALGVTRVHVNQMVMTGRVPPQQCRKIEKATGGKVTAEQLRPDVFGPA